MTRKGEGRAGDPLDGDLRKSRWETEVAQPRAVVELVTFWRYLEGRANGIFC